MSAGRGSEAPKRSPMRARGIVVVSVGGAVLTMGTALIAGMGVRDAAPLAAVAGGSAAGAGLLGASAMFLFRRQSVGVQAILVALTSIAAVAAGALVASEAMFLSEHDLDALLVVLAASVTVGVVVSLVLGRRVGRAGVALRAATRKIGEGNLSSPVEPPPTREFADLARELEAMSRRLDEATARARRLEASRRELVAWVSHDLRTPMAGIRAMAEALEDGVVSDPASVARYHRTIKAETERLARLVDELFELSVIQSGALRLEMERVSLDELVSDALAAASPAATARGVRLQGRLDRRREAGPAPELELSPPEVARVLRNLLDNAIRHTPSDGSVWVETGVRGDEAFVAVADECGGIPEPDLARVFETAFRGETARTPADDGGAGLGLAIARGIVEAHHGGITVRNEGEGCRFEVRLPVRS